MSIKVLRSVVLFTHSLLCGIVVLDTNISFLNLQLPVLLLMCECGGLIYIMHK